MGIVIMVWCRYFAFGHLNPSGTDCLAPCLDVARSGHQKPTEAFSFECEVTAHQAAGVSLPAMATGAAFGGCCLGCCSGILHKLP